MELLREGLVVLIYLVKYGDCRKRWYHIPAILIKSLASGTLACCPLAVGTLFCDRKEV